MPRIGSTLSNCYIPIPVATSTAQKINPNCRSSGDGTTRTFKSLRRLCLDRSVLAASSGSSLVELGHTKVICSVHGPRPAASSSFNVGGTLKFHSGGVLNCEVRHAPYFGIRAESQILTTPINLDGYVRSSSRSNFGNTSKDEIELSSRLHDAILPSIPLDILRKNVVDVFVMVIQNDGCAFGASVVAASLALADSGIELFDLVSTCSIAIIPTEVTGHNEDIDSSTARQGGGGRLMLLADPTEEEIQASDGVVTLTMMPNWKEITFWEQTGKFPVNTASDAADLCRDGCAAMHKFMRNCISANSSSVLES